MVAQPRLTGCLCLVLLTAGFSGCSRSPEAKEAKFLSRGQALLAQKDYSRALLEFRNAAGVMPKDAEPHYRMGMAYLESRDMSGAVRAFQKATALNPKHSGAQLKLAELMTVSSNRNVIQESFSRLQSVFGDSPDNPEAIDTLALAEWKLGKPENATERLTEALKKFPTHLESSVVLARMKLSAKDWNGAEEVLKQAVADAPQSSPAETALGEFYLILRQPAKAEAELKKAAQLDPKNGNALIDLGALEIVAGRLDEAEQTYKRLAALPGKAYKPVHAMFLYRYGKRDAALTELESLYKSDPNDREARTRLVSAYVGMNRVAPAENVLAEALKRNPKDAEALQQRAGLRLRSGRADDAEKDLKEVLHFKPDSASAHFALATAYRAKNLPNNQQEELQQAVKLAPALLPARLALAMSFINRRQSQAALAVIDQAPESQKKQLEWIIGRNWALLSMDNYQEAKGGIDQALRDGRPLPAVYQDAILHFLQHDHADARALLEELLKRDVTDARVVELLMETYAAQQQVPKGVAKLKELVAAHPQSAPLQNLVGQWSRRAGDTAAARKAFESAKAADPHFVPADLSLAEMEIAEGRDAEALHRLNEVVTTDPKNVDALLLSAHAQEVVGAHAAEVASYRAVLNLEQSNLIALNNLAYVLAPDDPDEALKLAQQAAEMAPDSPNVQDTLGWIYYRKGLYSMAVRYLKTAVDKESTPRRQFHLGMSYLKTGDQLNGQKIVRDALAKDPTLAKTEQGW
jgi:tetratricopeptide (TPR) repeat protein